MKVPVIKRGESKTHPKFIESNLYNYYGVTKDADLLLQEKEVFIHKGKITCLLSSEHAEPIN